MKLRDELNVMTPRLRRYARALATGSPAGCDLADDLVHATLMRAVGSRHVGTSEDLVIRCYATVTQLHRDLYARGRSAVAAGARRPALVMGSAGVPAAARNTKLSAGLLSLTLEDREALLLVVLEGFGHSEAARILRVSKSVLLGRLTHARTTLDACLRASPVAKARASAVPYLRVVT